MDEKDKNTEENFSNENTEIPTQEDNSMFADFSNDNDTASLFDEPDMSNENIEEEIKEVEQANDSLFEQEPSKEILEEELSKEENYIEEDSIENNIPENIQEEFSETQEIISNINEKEDTTIKTQTLKTNPAPTVLTQDEFEEPIKEMITVRPVKFQQFEQTEPIRAIKKNLDIMQDISMHISVELGRTKSSIREVMEMEKGSIVELDKIAGEQVEIFVNEKLVAKGEVIVIEDKFGVRVTSTSFGPQNQNF